MLTAGARTRKARAHRGLEPAHLAAGAGEDRAALSGRPRKANAGQYATVMQQRDPARSRNAKMQAEYIVPRMSALHFRDALAASIAR